METANVDIVSDDDDDVDDNGERKNQSEKNFSHLCKSN